MIWNFVKKQLLLVIRDRSNFTLLLAMPIVLIVIIKFAVGNFMDGEASPIDADIAIVEHSNEEAEINRVLDNIAALPISEEEKAQISTSISAIQPIQMLKENVFGNEELQEMLRLEEIQLEEVEAAKENETYDVIVEVPENFTYQLLTNSISNEKKEVPQITLYANDEAQFETQMVRDILLLFEDQVKTNMVLGKYGMADEVVLAEDLKSEVRSVSKVEPITSTLYYSIGMSVMFVLYIASTIGSYAYMEKRIHVFDRIILADISKWMYFSGTFVSGTILAFIQLMILFGMALVAFGVTWPSATQFLVVSALISMSVGALASLITAIDYRVNSDAASDIFSSVVVSTLALLGGTFFPIGEMSPFLQMLSNITPNGAALSAYLTTAQGYGFTEIGYSSIYLVAFTVIVMIIAAWIMPKRGQVA